MTCWYLRNMLFPFLWKYTEGYSGLFHKADRFNNGLYAQCSYLILNPTVGIYVQCVKVWVLFYASRTHVVFLLCRALSVYLHFKPAPKDLMAKFVDCLIQLPNLTTLEVFGTDSAGSIARGLERRSPLFPNIRELGISGDTAKFIENCPNVETITALHELSLENAMILGSHGKKLKKLKRVVGIAEDCVRLGEFEDN